MRTRTVTVSYLGDIIPKLENRFVQRFMEARIWKNKGRLLGLRV